MIAILIVVIIAVLLARLDIRNRTDRNYGLISAFVLLAAFLSIRWNFGNDYSHYFDYFQWLKDANIGIGEYYNGRYGMEWGWKVINVLCLPIGFFGMIIVLTCVEYAIIYRFITKYLERQYYWFAVLIFGLSVGLLINSVEVIRQFLAECICLLAFEQLINKRLPLALGIVFIASLVHISALILFPICLYGYYCYKWVKNYNFAIILILVLVILYLFGRYFLKDILEKMITIDDVFLRYENYLSIEKKDKGFVTWLRNLYDSMIIIIVVLCGRQQVNRYGLILLNIYIYTYVFEAMGMISVLVSRFCFYFSLVGIVVLPIIFSSIRSRFWRNLISFSYVLRIAYSFFTLFDMQGWHAAFWEYHTIFEAPYWM